MNGIVTNDRFDKLTNLDISTHYREREYHLFPSDILSAFAYWIVSQNPNKALIDIKPALLEVADYIAPNFKDVRIPEKFSYDQLKLLIDDARLEELPAILALNQLKPDYIDLGALARNVFYMVLREQITQ